MRMRLVRMLAAASESYAVTAMIGFLFGGILYTVLAGANRELQYDSQMLVIIVVAGVALGAAVTFTARLMLDHIEE